MSELSTKEKILDAALTLFSKNGYDGTSVEQIAESVGIKAPSLYKHFKGKEDILSNIIDLSEKRYEKNFGSESNIGQIPKTREEFVKINMDKILFTVKDPVIRRIRTFIVKEQFRSERLARIMSWHQYDGLKKILVKVMDKMMKSGFLRENDSEMLAIEIYAPCTLMVAIVDRQPEREEEVLEFMERYFGHFYDTYAKH